MATRLFEGDNSPASRPTTDGLSTEVPQFKDTLGWASYKVGKADEAAALIEDAAKQLPDLPVFRYQLGMSYLALNNKEAARKELEKAIALGEGKGFLEAEQARKALQGL